MIGQLYLRAFLLVVGYLSYPIVPRLRHIVPNALISKALQSTPSGNRFWVERVDLNSNFKLKIANLTDPNELFKTVLLHLCIDSTKIDVGMLIIPPILSADFTHKIIPVHSGILQTQHTNVLPLFSTSTSASNLSRLSALSVSMELEPSDSVLLCGFFPRASHENEKEADETRSFDSDRFTAVNRALTEKYNISHEELLLDKYDGSTPTRIYRSFVYPRKRPNYRMDPLEKAANRTATQIELALRQMRADEATYLRNIDKASPVNRLSSPSSPSPTSVTTANTNSSCADPSSDLYPLPQQATQSSVARPSIVLLLDNLRSAFNVGSIFRTAETSGVSEVITAGICPHPPHDKLRKTAFTAIDNVPSSHYEDVLAAVQQAKAVGGFKIVVLETTSKSQVYSDVRYPVENTMLVLGNELTGVDTRIIELADMVVEIPTYGAKNSLNVASCAAVVTYEVLRQWRENGV